MATIIHMPLLNEGTPVWRPVLAEALEGGGCRVIGQASDDEEWASGTVVVVDRNNRIVSEAEA